ncbi:hypothetical protein NQ318_003460 [Aromia moschata]|uniref:Uncharacterized protein n=1 Tax=Aromia moschata TaxID=1265417 RepID=A0AAV8YX65_9CUCU|nr:hypothetical protein NQ318_003460 [Aromia moschata]
MMAIDCEYGEKIDIDKNEKSNNEMGDVLRNSLLARYFGKNFCCHTKQFGTRKYKLPPLLTGRGSKSSKQGRPTLHEVQTHLDREGASDLVSKLGIALLEGGNTVIQKSMFNKTAREVISVRLF